MNRIPVILDTDPGVDDFFAILLAASTPALDLRAITVVAGNCPLQVTASNALAIAERYGIHVPVVKGAAQPLNSPAYTAEEIHGTGGLGQLKIPEPAGAFSNGYAWDTIYQEAVKQEGRLELIAIGPMTNLAIALLKYPDLPRRINRVVIMGGSTDTGNITPYAEFNIYADPLAADILVQSGIPLVMVGLNTTMSSYFTPNEMQALTAGDSVVCQDCRTLAEGMREIYSQNKWEGIALHDVFAVAYAADSNALVCRPHHLSVERQSVLNLGRTVVELEHVCNPHPANCLVALDANHENLLGQLRGMIQFYSEKGNRL